MEITGRLTANATVATTKSEKQVVNFSIAVNDRYRTKGSDETKEITTYIDCAYWLNAGAAEWLKKGTLVQLYGRIGVNAYINASGQAVGRMTCHVNEIKVLLFAKKTEAAKDSVPVGGANDDLPF